MNALYINGILKTPDSLRPVRHFQYRGILDFCNYACHYCPFSKRPIRETTIEKDKECLSKLLQRLCLETEPFTFQLVPYGEALLHTYYWEFLANLSKLPAVLAVGCQTNASFSAEKMLSIFQKHGGMIKKLRLWCSFHPSMISPQAFSKQIIQLHQLNITLCAGAVADPESIPAISHLFSLLPNDIYFWLNNMDGKKRPYTPEERAFFQQIDPFFALEERRISAKHRPCSAEHLSCCAEKQDKEITPTQHHLFIRANGDYFACNLSTKKLGNLYEQQQKSISFSCKRTCSCFLAYQNHLELLPELCLFLPHPSFRIVKKYEAAFFDIDNTLLPSGETSIPAKTEQILKTLSRYCPIYLATSLPYPAAMKKCSTILSYLSGGIFSCGAHIVCGDRVSPKQKKHYYTQIDPDAAARLCSHYAQQPWTVRCYHTKPHDTHSSEIYKITLLPKQKKHLPCQQDITLTDPSVRFLTENHHIQILPATAQKRSGVSFICSQMGYSTKHILTCGDSIEDRDMAFL